MLDSFIIIIFQDIYKKLLLHWILYIHYVYQSIKSPISQTSIGLCLDLNLEKPKSIFSIDQYQSINATENLKIYIECQLLNFISFIKFNQKLPKMKF